MKQNKFLLLIAILVLSSSVIGFNAGYIYGKSGNIKNLFVSKTNQNSVVNTNSKIAPSYDYNYWAVNAYNSVNIPISNHCQMNHSVEEKEFLNTYQVKKGDTFEAVARDILGNISRSEELMVLNGKGYAGSSISDMGKQDFLEVGWRLYLPPKFIDRSSGFLQVWKGEFIEESEHTWTLLTGGSFSGSLVRVIFKNDNPRILGKTDFHAGDCVAVLLDFGNKYKVLAISSQDKDYFIDIED